MTLVLNEIESLIANEKMKDDAFELWVTSKNPDKMFTSPAAFYSRHHIQQNDSYLKVSFVDTETGELFFINCLPKLHKAMISFNIYPEFILNAFKH